MKRIRIQKKVILDLKKFNNILMKTKRKYKNGDIIF